MEPDYDNMSDEDLSDACDDGELDAIIEGSRRDHEQWTIKKAEFKAQIAQLEADLAQQIEVNLKLHEKNTALEARVADLAARVAS